MVQFANSTRNDRNESAIDLSSSSPDDSVHDDSQPPPTNGDEKRSRRGKKRRRAKEATGAIEVNGTSHRPSSRKNSLSKAARDPRDEPEKKVKRKKQKTEGTGTETRSPSPVIDFDGLSRPSPSSLPTITLIHTIPLPHL